MKTWPWLSISYHQPCTLLPNQFKNFQNYTKHAGLNLSNLDTLTLKSLHLLTSPTITVMSQHEWFVCSQVISVLEFQFNQTSQFLFYLSRIPTNDVFLFMDFLFQEAFSDYFVLLIYLLDSLSSTSGIYYLFQIFQQLNTFFLFCLVVYIKKSLQLLYLKSNSMIKGIFLVFLLLHLVQCFKKSIVFFRIQLSLYI